ncbi:hypothetical protein QQX98_008150 [Neonectria punicea]|uniref:Major facilitator superfamily (MFS) profile domain-containing protein n=1 Tax=Neonectria punicea TaxID=979145 RepID=A0ABR1GVY1_9HYPO
MAFGVFETPIGGEHVPGTCQLEHDATGRATQLKKAGRKDDDPVLVPQPSNDPNDPLNWPLYQRDLVLLLLCYCTNICVGGPRRLSPVSQVRKTTSPTYNVLLGGRILQGLGTAAFESITFSAVGDLYFDHQRGLRMALYVSSAVGMVLLPGLIAGVVAVSLDWRPGCDNWRLTSSINAAERRDPVLRRMRPCSGVFDDRSLLKITLQPFYLIANPVVCWAVVLNGFAQLWNVVVSFALAQIFSPPPYLMDSARLGYLNTGPIVAGLVSSLVCGLVSDHIAVFISKRNNGVFEPEFRLLLLLIAPIFSSVGFFLFSKLAEEGKSPILISFVWGLAFVSTQVIGTATGGYLVDAYREVDVHIFVLSMSAKNLMFFGFSYFINDWVTQWGPARVFQCIGSIMLGLTATTIPVYIVLEIGCGQGTCTVVLGHATGREGHVDAIDPAPLDYGAPYTLGQAQEHIAKGDMGERVRFWQRHLEEFLAETGGKKWDYAVLVHCAWYLDGTETLARMLKALKGRVDKVCIAEYSMKASEPAAVPHVLAALTQATLSAQMPESKANIRCLLTPHDIKQIAEHAGWKVEREMDFVPNERLQDGGWEVGAVKSEDFLDDVEKYVKDDKIKVLLRGAREAVCRATEEPHGEKVRTMNVWAATLVE